MSLFPAPSFPLRDYQKRALAHASDAWRAGKRRILLVAPTGAGKTRIGAEFGRAGDVLWIAHRRELVSQARERLAAEGSPHVRVESIQGLLASGERPKARLVVLDEAHHYVAAQWGSIRDAYSDATIVGLTATPERADKTSLGDLFECLIPVATVRELTDRGVLVPCEVWAPPSRLEGLAMSPIAAWERFGQGRPTVIFAANVPEARRCAEELRSRGVRAACVDGESSTRDRDVAAFEARALDVLVNVYVLTEGWDAPHAEVCILARGCGAVGTYLQIVGRVLRACEGKSSALLVDLRGSVHVHGLPEDPREYSLDGKAIRKVSALPSLRVCLVCGMTYRSAPQCTRCGFEFPPLEGPRVVGGELSRVTSVASPAEKAAALAQLRNVARTRKLSAGWVSWAFAKRFGHKPEVGA